MNSNATSFLQRNARFLWLMLLFVPPGVAFLAYDLMPHEEIWQEVIYSLICVPLFLVWTFALFGSVLSFVFYRSLAK